MLFVWFLFYTANWKGIPVTDSYQLNVGKCYPDPGWQLSVGVFSFKILIWTVPKIQTFRVKHGLTLGVSLYNVMLHCVVLITVINIHIISHVTVLIKHNK